MFAAYKVGVEAMKSVRKDMTLEKAEDMKAELQDLVEEGEDIAAVLGERGMHPCMYVCICMYICTYLHMYVHLYISAYVCTFVHICICMYICTYLHMYVHLYISA